MFANTKYVELFLLVFSMLSKDYLLVVVICALFGSLQCCSLRALKLRNGGGVKGVGCEHSFHNHSSSSASDKTTNLVYAIISTFHDRARYCCIQRDKHDLPISLLFACLPSAAETRSTAIAERSNLPDHRATLYQQLMTPIQHESK